jgi:hypothetical protein
VLPDGIRHPPFQQIGQLIHQGQKEALFVGEVEIDGAFGCVAFVHNLVHAGVMIAFAAKDIQRGVEDALFGIFRVAGSLGHKMPVFTFLRTASWPGLSSVIVL